MNTSHFARKFAVTLLLSGLADCGTSPGGSDYAELELRTSDTQGNVINHPCLPLPVLPGGKIEREVALAPSLTAHVVADRNAIDVRLLTGNSATTVDRKLLHDTLVEGYSEDIDVNAAGTHYALSFISPCATSE